MSRLAEARDLSWTSLLTLGSLHRPWINAGLVSLNLAMDKLKPNDPRYKREYTDVKGHRWSYLDASPKGPPKGVVVLVHGFPDISFAWRYQIPMLLDLGFRCIAIDCMGYGETGTSTNLQDFTYKTHADAIEGIASSLNISKIILGGHDWGGMVVYRVAQWKPSLVSHVFSVCTAYMPISETFTPTVELVKKLPNFGYQLQFGSEDGEVEKVVNDKATLRRFLGGLYGGKTSSGRHIMTPEKGVDLGVVKNDTIGASPLISEEELTYYVHEFSKNGIRGPLNWYRTRELNFRDEVDMPAAQKNRITQPTLYILATKDAVLKRELSNGMEKVIPNLTRGEVPATHWALWHTPQETNEIIKGWFEGVVLGGRSKL